MTGYPSARSEQKPLYIARTQTAAHPLSSSVISVQSDGQAFPKADDLSKATFFVFGLRAKTYVVGDVQAAQDSSPHRVSDGQRRARQLPKVNSSVSGGIVWQLVPAILFFHFSSHRAVAPLICLGFA
jgi:hypothetical protein